MASETLIKIGIRSLIVAIIFPVILYVMMKLMSESVGLFFTNKIFLIGEGIAILVTILSFWGAQQFKTKVQIMEK